MLQKKLKLKLTGVSPLIFHNITHFINPLSELKIAIGNLTSKRKKSIDDYKEISRLEWNGGLYLNDKGRVIIPGHGLEAALNSAGKLNKLGKRINETTFCEDALLDYDGPKNLDSLFADGNFTLTVPVTVQRQKVMRTRPIFRKWGAKIVIIYDSDRIDEGDVIETAKNCGRVTGMFEWRPRNGRFEVEVLK